MTHDVFISYSSKDKVSADAACEVLEAKGVSCWIAPRDIVPGADWSASIVRAIASARVFVLVFSANANSSPQIKREVERAVNRGIPVIPVRVEDTKPSEALEYFISTPHWFDAFPPPLGQHLDYLAEVVLGVLRGATTPVPPPPRPLPVMRRHRSALIAAAAALLLLLAGVGGWLAFRTVPPDAQFGPECMVKVAEPSAAVCTVLLAQNAQWQNCSSSFARQDMDKAARRAGELIDAGDAGSALYYDARFYGGAYGTISHYWEKLGECLNRNYLTFDRLSGGVAFPQYFWVRTHGVRQTFLSNWSGRNAPLPDFMSNFQSLCLRYKQERNQVRPGSGDALDCSL